MREMDRGLYRVVMGFWEGAEGNSIGSLLENLRFCHIIG